MTSSRPRNRTLSKRTRNEMKLWNSGRIDFCDLSAVIQGLSGDWRRADSRISYSIARQFSDPLPPRSKTATLKLLPRGITSASRHFHHPNLPAESPNLGNSSHSHKRKKCPAKPSSTPSTIHSHSIIFFYSPHPFSRTPSRSATRDQSVKMSMLSLDVPDTAATNTIFFGLSRGLRKHVGVVRVLFRTGDTREMEKEMGSNLFRLKEDGQNGKSLWEPRYETDLSISLFLVEPKLRQIVISGNHLEQRLVNGSVIRCDQGGDRLCCAGDRF
ncbi:hypothetical protein RRG08_064129 [Elysia crispata]|uniref:Uncharacterized protein n=1 Tax=Elysia crispata TaxID=231223 RepID=A0AAE0ZM61_9GAST|nr:hypothetical protein RRG08_064129 [Elysia crispata]